MYNGEIIAKNALEMLGTPFRHQGRIPGVSLDCAGLVVCSFRNAGYEVFDHPGNYMRSPNKEDLLDYLLPQVEVFDKEMINLREPGDILVFNFLNVPRHLAIVALDLGMIHAYEPNKKVITHSFDKKWVKRLMFFCRYNGDK